MAPAAGVGTTALAVASVSQATSAAPLAWFISVGTAWQALQASAAVRRPVPVRCFWCAPTLGLLLAVVPLVASGGAALTAPPWQLLQAAVFCRVPLMCSVAAAVPVPVKMMPPEVLTTVLWHGLQVPKFVADFDTLVWTGSFGAP